MPTAVQPWKDIESDPEYVALPEMDRGKVFEWWKGQVRNAAKAEGSPDEEIESELNSFTAQLGARNATGAALTASEVMTAPLRMDWERPADSLGGIAIEPGSERVTVPPGTDILPTVPDQDTGQGRFMSAMNAIGQTAMRIGGGALQSAGELLEGPSPDKVRAEIESLRAAMAQEQPGVAKGDMDALKRYTRAYNRIRALEPDLEGRGELASGAGMAMREKAGDVFQTNPRFAGEFWADVLPRGAGSLIPLALTRDPKLAAGLMGSSTFVEQRDANLARGMPEDEAVGRALATAATEAGLEYVGGKAVTGAVGKALGVEGRAARAGVAAAGEGLTEGSQNVAAAVINQQPIDVGMLVKETMAGALLGGAAGAIIPDPDTGIVRTPAGPVKDGRIIAESSPDAIAAQAMKGLDAVKPTELPAAPAPENISGIKPGEKVTEAPAETKEQRLERFRAGMEERRRQRDEQVQSVLKASGDVGGVELQSSQRSDHKLIVTPDIQDPGKWRVTMIDEQGPYGHHVFDSREAAIRAAGGESGTDMVKGPPYFAHGPYEVTRTKTTDKAPAPGPDVHEVEGVPVGRVQVAEIATRPDVMQFKRMTNAQTGAAEHHAETISGEWDDIKAGNLLLWEPQDPAAYGLAPGQKYIVADGHGRFLYGGKAAVNSFNAQILREADGVSAQEARTIAAEKNIADGKGTIYDQAKFLRNSAAAHGKDEALARARRNGIQGRKAATIAFNASDPTFDSFINEVITAEQAAAIAQAAPGNEAAQQIGLRAIAKGRDAQQAANDIQGALGMVGTEKASQTDMFADTAMQAEWERVGDYATGKQRELTEQIRAVQNAARNPETAKKFGVDVKDPEGILRRIDELKAERDRWQNYSKHSDLLAEARGTAGARAPEPTGAPEPAELPKLRSMESQGDLLSTQAEPEAFKLAGETGTDFDAIAQEQARLDAAKAESDKLQGNLFGDEPPRNLGPGAANIEEPLGEHPKIGTFNAKVEEQRAQRGLPPLVSEARKSDAEMWDRTEQRVDRDPLLPGRVTDQILDGTIKVPSDEDQTVLLYRMTDLRNRRLMASDRINALDTTETERAQAMQDFVELEKQLHRTEEASRKGGTEQGRALRARRIMAFDDYTLAPMESRARIAKGEPLTPEESAKIKQQADRIAELEKQLAAAESKGDDSAAIIALEAKIKEMQAAIDARPQFDSRILAYAEKVVSGWENAAASAAQRIRARLGRTNMPGLDLGLLADVALVARAKIARGALKFANFADDLIRDFGEVIRPYLQPAWDKAQTDVENVGENVPAKDREKVRKAIKKEDTAEKQKEITESLMESNTEGSPLSEMRFQIQRLAENFVRSGIKQREPLIDAVHNVLKTIEPDISRRQTMDLISGYGDFKALNPDAIKAELRDLKGQMQQVAKIEDIQARKPLQKTGVQRREPSNEERRLTQQVNEAKRRFGVVVTDPASQLKSALDSRKTYVRNRLSDLRHEIATRQRIVKERSLPPTDPELEALRAEYDAVKAEHTNVFGKREMTDEQRLKLAIGAAERTEAQWTQRLENAKKGIFDPPAPGSKVPASAKLDAIRARTDAVRAQVAELKGLDVALQESAKEAGLQKSIAELERRIKAGEIEPKTGTPTADTKAVAELKTRRAELQKKISDARKGPPVPEEVRQLEALQKRIVELEAKIAAGDTSVRTGKPTVPTKEITEAKARLKELNDQLRELRNGPKKSPEERAIQSFKTRTANQIADLTDRIARGDFAKAPRKQYDISKDPAAVRLKTQADAVKKEFNQKRFDWEQAQRSRVQKTLDFSKEVLASTRTLITSADVSAPFRQGGFLVIGDLVTNPVRAARQIGNMFRSLVSKKSFDESETALRLRPNADVAEKWKLYLSDPHGTFSQREENMRSNLAEKIPVVGGIVRGSNRAYAGFLNRQRQDALDSFVNMMGGKSKVSDADGRFLAEAINDMTGRAELPAKMVGTANFLARYLFSPRFLISRFKLLVGEPIWRDITKGEISPKARAVVALQYAKFALGLSALYGLAALAGAKVEKDPRSADFGKLRFGQTRIDPLAGLQQLSVLMSRLGTGKTKTVGGKLESIRVAPDGKKPRQTAVYVLARFGRSKLAPIPGAIIDWTQGETMDFEPTTVGGTATRLTVPISYQDAPAVYKEQGAVKGTIIEMLNLLGAGVQHYDRK